MSRYLDKILAVRTRESELNLDKRESGLEEHIC